MSYELRYGAQRMLLREIAETSSRVSGTGGRLEKIGHLADTLRRLEPEEIGIGVSYLSGELRQGRIGIGYSTLEKAAPSSAARSAGITLRDVDAAFERIARISGRGSAGERITVLGDLHWPNIQCSSPRNMVLTSLTSGCIINCPIRLRPPRTGREGGVPVDAGLTDR